VHEAGVVSAMQAEELLSRLEGLAEQLKIPVRYAALNTEELSGRGGLCILRGSDGSSSNGPWAIERRLACSRRVSPSSILRACSCCRRFGKRSRRPRRRARYRRREMIGERRSTLGEMAVQEVRLDGVEVEASTRFIHERGQTRRRIVAAALADPLDRLFQTDFQLCVHSGPSPGTRASAGLRAVFHRKYSRSNPSGQDHRTLPNLRLSRAGPPGGPSARLAPRRSRLALAPGRPRAGRGPPHRRRARPRARRRRDRPAARRRGTTPSGCSSGGIPSADGRIDAGRDAASRARVRVSRRFGTLSPTLRGLGSDGNVK